MPPPTTTSDEVGTKPAVKLASLTILSAIQANDINLLKRMLDAGANMDFCPNPHYDDYQCHIDVPKGETSPLVMSVFYSNYEATKILLERGAKIQECFSLKTHANCRLYTLLSITVRNNCYAISKLLMAHGVSAEPPLMISLWALSPTTRAVNAYPPPILEAALRNDVPHTKLLLDSGITASLYSPGDGSCALLAALEHGSTEVADLLLGVRHRTPFPQLNGEQLTIVQLCAYNRHLNALQALQQRGFAMCCRAHGIDGRCKKAVQLQHMPESQVCDKCRTEYVPPVVEVKVESKGGKEGKDKEKEKEKEKEKGKKKEDGSGDKEKDKKTSPSSASSASTVTSTQAHTSISPTTTASVAAPTAAGTIAPSVAGVANVDTVPGVPGVSTCAGAAALSPPASSPEEEAFAPACPLALCLSAPPRRGPPEKTDATLVAIVRYLVSCGASPDCEYNHLPAIHYALAHQHITAARALLRLGATVNYPVTRGMPPLWYAVRRGGAALTEDLLKHGANVGPCMSTSKLSRVTALHVACGSADAAVVDVLLRYGADMFLYTTQSSTLEPPVWCALNQPPVLRHQIVQVIVKHGFTPRGVGVASFANICARTEAAAGTVRPKREVFLNFLDSLLAPLALDEFLLPDAKGDRLAAIARGMSSSLLYAAVCKRIPALAIMNLDALGKYTSGSSLTALFPSNAISTATMAGDVSAVRFLVDCGLNVWEKGEDGEYPLSRALREFKKGIYRELCRNLRWKAPENQISDDPQNSGSDLSALAEIEALSALTDEALILSQVSNVPLTSTAAYGPNSAQNVMNSLLPHGATAASTGTGEGTGVGEDGEDGEDEGDEEDENAANTLVFDASALTMRGSDGVSRPYFSSLSTSTSTSTSGSASIYSLAAAVEDILDEDDALALALAAHSHDAEMLPSTSTSMMSQSGAYGSSASSVAHDYASKDPERARAMVEAIYHAILRSDVDFIACVMDAGVDANMPDSEGRTPLMWAAIRGEREIARWLLEYGADPTLCDKVRDDAFTLAMRNGNAGLLHLLNKYQKARRQ